MIKTFSIILIVFHFIFLIDRTQGLELYPKIIDSFWYISTFGVLFLGSLVYNYFKRESKRRLLDTVALGAVGIVSLIILEFLTMSRVVGKCNDSTYYYYPNFESVIDFSTVDVYSYSLNSPFPFPERREKVKEVGITRNTKITIDLVCEDNEIN